MVKAALLIISILLLNPPFTPIGIGGLIGWGMITMLFKAADQGVEEMASVLASGWALGKSMQECESEARRRLMEGE